MAISIRHLIFLCIGASATISLYAQAPAETPLTIKFTAYAINKPSEQIFYLPRTDSTSKPIQFFTSAKTTVQNYTGPNPITFFNEQPSSDPAQAPSRKILARVLVPAEIKEPLFLFFPNPEFTKNQTAPQYLVFTFDDGTDKLPAGHVALINASGLEFVGQFNSEVVKIARGLNAPIKVGNSAKIDLRTMIRGKFFQSYLSSHSFLGNERALILLLPPINPGSIEVQVRILRSEVPEQKKN